MWTVTVIRTVTVIPKLGRLFKSIGAASQETVFSYDRTDLTVQVIDPRNKLYVYTYEAVARLNLVTVMDCHRNSAF